MGSRIQEIWSLFGSNPAITDLQWRPAQSYSIQREPTRQVWHAGHVSALLSDGNYVIAGTQTGGVWLLTPVVQPSYRDGHRATPLSNDWTFPDVSSLAYGPDARTQVFVGCASTDLLYFLQLRPLVGSVELERKTEIPLPFKATVFGIAILGPLSTIEGQWQLVLATSNGVWWANVPNAPHNAGAYHWSLAEGLPDGPYSGIAPAGWTGDGRLAVSRQNVAVAAYGTTSSPQGIFLGEWQGGKLVFSAATIQGVNVTAMRRTSMASCADQPQRLYAVSAASDQTPLAVLASSDGGANWSPLGSLPSSQYTGVQGDWAQCIAVSPRDPDVVAFGWVAGGPFFWDKVAKAWRHPTTDVPKGDGAGQDNSLHGDTHALYFARTAAAQDTLYLGSDGGVVYTKDLGQTYSSQFNRSLHNLQIYGNDNSEQIGLSYGVVPGPGGCLAASSRFPGLLACGTQDNGNLFLAPKQEAGLAWQALEGGDGGLCLFIDGIAGLLRDNNGTPQAALSLWNDSQQAFAPSPAAIVLVGGTAAGMSPTAMAAVTDPVWANQGQLMYACTGDVAGNLYGLFANADGTRARLMKLASVGSEVVGLASLDGQSIVAGTIDGRVVRLTTATGALADETLPPDFSGQQNKMVSRIEIVQTLADSLRLVGIEHPRMYALRGWTLLYFDGREWRTLPGAEWVTFAVEADSDRVFAADQASVFELSSDRNSWRQVANGLPSFSHCTDLRIATNSDRGRDLFLATYGRSVWRAAITSSPPSLGLPNVPPLVGEVLFGIIQDGGGLFRVGNQVHVIPPRPVLREILVGLAIYGLADALGDESRRAIQRTVLEQIAAIATRELGRFST
jgi:hypothetical protein